MIYEIKNLSFAYGSKRQNVLNEVNFSLAEGELVTLLGRNGAGKSTLFGCMLGLLKPKSGNIYLQGNELAHMSEKRIASVVSYVPQNHVPGFEYSVFEFVLMGCAAKVGLFSSPGEEEKAAAWQAIRQMGLEELAHRSYARLSGGERQQAAIARALASQPKAIIFDEPTAHLDMANQMKVLKIIKELSKQGYAVAVSTHDPNHALMLGGTVAILDRDGHITSGDAETLLTEERLSDTYSTEIRLRYLEEFNRRVCIFPEL